MPQPSHLISSQQDSPANEVLSIEAHNTEDSSETIRLSGGTCVEVPFDA